MICSLGKRLRQDSLRISLLTTDFRRLLISQDFFEIYLTIAEYNSKYIRYLHGDEKATIGEPSFLTMKQYGPWNTGLYQHMRHLGRLMLGFALQQLEIESYQEDPFTGPSTKKPR